MLKSGLPDFSWHNIPKRGNMYIPNCQSITQWPYKIPNGHKMYQHFPLYLRPSKIYPDWDFWFEKIPSGNPGPNTFYIMESWHFTRLHFLSPMGDLNFDSFMFAFLAPGDRDAVRRSVLSNLITFLAKKTYEYNVVQMYVV
jgi:hypothetical protein